MNPAILTEYLDSLASRGIPGCDCAVFQNHTPVFRHMAGFADEQQKKPLTHATTFMLFSASKLITCTAVLQLIEKGAVRLDDPVSVYLPEYGNVRVKHASGLVRAENAMTIRHLLSMQSGLNYNCNAPAIVKIVRETEGRASTREVIRALAEEPLDFEPGTHFQYSLSHDVLGAVIEEATGQRFAAYLQEHIFEPLHMKNTGFSFTKERMENMAAQYDYHMDTMTATPRALEKGFILSENYESGGAGILSTADDYIRFADALCNYGTSDDGYRLLTRDSIELMRTNQLHDASKQDFDKLRKKGYSYGLGVRVLVEKEQSGAKSPIGEFGWDGAAGAYVMIDPEHRLAVFYVQHTLGCDYAFDVIHPQIRDLTYAMLES